MRALRVFCSPQATSPPAQKTFRKYREGESIDILSLVCSILEKFSFTQAHFFDREKYSGGDGDINIYSPVNGHSSDVT